jgi:hypothetical protein
VLIDLSTACNTARGCGLYVDLPDYTERVVHPMDSTVIYQEHADRESSRTLSDIAAENCFTLEGTQCHQLNICHC